MNTVSNDVLSQKLDSLARCLARIESKKPFALEKLLQDFDLQDILAINIERAVQICADISAHCISQSGEPIAAPVTLSEGFRALANLGWITAETGEQMARAAGFRNIAVHEYQRVNWAIAYAVAHQHLDDFRGFARQVAEKAGLV